MPIYDLNMTLISILFFLFIRLISEFGIEALEMLPDCQDWQNDCKLPHLFPQLSHCLGMVQHVTTIWQVLRIELRRKVLHEDSVQI